MPFSSSLQELLISTSPRGVFLRPSQIKSYFDTDYSDLSPLANDSDPSLLLVNSPKHNYQYSNARLLRDYTSLASFDSVSSIYGMSGSTNQSAHSNYWLYSQCRDGWYWNQLKALKLAKRLGFVPGISKIFLTGSSSIEAASQYSDIDLIIETKKGWSWVVRLWLKIWLKISNQDVYKARFQVLKLLSKLKLVSPLDVNQRILNYKNSAQGRVDIGLITENWSRFQGEFIQKSPHTVFFRTTKLLYSADDQVELTLDQDLHIWESSLFKILKIVLYLISIIIYPFVIVWAAIYINIHKNNPKFVISLSDICFYPLIPVLYGKFVER